MVTVRKLSRLIKEYTKSFKEKRPIFLHISPTKRCNLECSYCHQYDNDSEDMSFEDFEKTITNLKNLGLSIVAFTGGEPMLWSPLEQTIQHCSEENLVTQLTTNGTLLDHERVEAFSDTGLDYLMVSADSVSDQTISNKFARKDLIDTLKYARFKGMLVSMNAVLTRENYADVYSLIELANQEDFYISVGMVTAHPSKPWEQNGLHFQFPRDNQLLTEITTTIGEYKDKDFPIIEPKQFFSDFLGHLMGEYKWDCNITKMRSIEVSPDKQIYLCSKLDAKSQYFADTINLDEFSQLKTDLSSVMEDCNSNCYINCAYNGQYYQTHKTEFLSRFAGPIFKSLF